jgi:UDP-3-O-[3-hydroxymyristoyl] N-acetylglucosamine deacetylase
MHINFLTDPVKQRTIAYETNCQGIGVHSGNKVHLTIKPAAANHGIRFVRTDLPGTPMIPALFNQVVDTSLATVIGSEGAIVSTIEHLMAALSALSIDNAVIALDAYEMPIMDGSARPFFELLEEVGVEEQEAERCFFVIKKPVELRDGNKFVAAYPFNGRKLSCTIEYDHPLIQTQAISVNLDPHVFREDISPARTFGFAQEVEMMKRFGLARGGSLENAIVVDQDKIMNPGGLRFADEFVRHKLLDCIGDFSLLGMPIVGHLVTYRSGHAFNHAFLEKLFQNKSSWQACPVVTPIEPTMPPLSRALAI